MPPALLSSVILAFFLLPGLKSLICDNLLVKRFPTSFV
jgi:hypothetical protein